MASRTAILILRLLNLALLAASLALIATDKLTIDLDDPSKKKITFKDVHAYRYLLSVAVIGCAYTLLHLPFAVAGIVRGKNNKPATTMAMALLLVLADIAFALMMATGAAAGLGFTHDVRRYVDRVVFGDDDDNTPGMDRLHRDTNRFFDMAYASSGLMLAAAACMAVMIMISVYSLVK